VAQALPDYALFRALPGAGPTYAPRLLAAFGEQRERYQSAAAIQKYAGIAPVTERSGKKCWVHWRLQCPKFLRQTFVEWAAETIPRSFWAGAYYQSQRDKGCSHQAALRALAFKWIRILYRCWQTRTPYDESTYLNALKRRGSPLLNSIVEAT
jgi:transposase